MNFTFEGLQSAQNALQKIQHFITEYHPHEKNKNLGTINEEYQKQFKTYINNDFDTPQAIALLWKLIQDEKVPLEEKYATLFDFDKVLGFDFEKHSEAREKQQAQSIPPAIEELAHARESARKNKDWATADSIRATLLKAGYEITDTEEGFQLKKIA